MGDSRMGAVGAAQALGRERSPSVWLRALLRGAGEGKPAGGEQLDQLEQEVALLREENARLKMGRQQAGERPVNERVRAAFPTLGEDGADADEPWEVLTECMLLRDGLVDACRELERGARELRARLETLLPNAEGPATESRRSDDFEGVA
jgi:hypothetical protein